MIPRHDGIPTRRTPFLTVGFIGLCALVFFWRLAAGSIPLTAYTLGFTPALLSGYQEPPPGLGSCWSSPL